MYWYTMQLCFSQMGIHDARDSDLFDLNVRLKRFIGYITHTNNTDNSEECKALESTAVKEGIPIIINCVIVSFIDCIMTIVGKCIR